MLVAHAYPAAADGERTRAEVTHELAPWRDRYPQVPVDYAIAAGSAADLLTRLSRRARLVIVGHRGEGGFTRLLLGTVSQHLIHTAHCPVPIARPGR